MFRKLMTLALIGVHVAGVILALIGGALAVGACNTVRGAAADVNSAANAVDNAT